MVKKVDVGKSPEEMCEAKPDKKIFPSLYLSVEELPSLKGKNVGDTGTLTADYKIVGKRLHEDGDLKEEKYDIDILKVALGETSAKEMDQTEAEKEKVKERLQRGKKA